jgi:hypothetical protein
MRGLVLASLALAVPSGLAIVDPGHASDSSSTHKRKAAPIDCKAPDAPYQHYECLDAYLGDGFWERLINYYRLEYGHGAAPADPDAPPDRRKPYPPAPESVPPYPFTEWPYGGAEYIGEPDHFRGQPPDGGIGPDAARQSHERGQHSDVWLG